VSERRQLYQCNVIVENDGRKQASNVLNAYIKVKRNIASVNAAIRMYNAVQ